MIELTYHYLGQYNLASQIWVLINGGIVGIDELKYECGSILEAWYP